MQTSVFDDVDLSVTKVVRKMRVWWAASPIDPKLSYSAMDPQEHAAMLIAAQRAEEFLHEAGVFPQEEKTREMVKQLAAA